MRQSPSSLSACGFVRQSACPCTSLSVSPPVRAPVHLLVRPSIGLRVSLSARLHAHLTAGPSVCPPVRTSACPSVCPSAMRVSGQTDRRTDWRTGGWTGVVGRTHRRTQVPGGRGRAGMRADGDRQMGSQGTDAVRRGLAGADGLNGLAASDADGDAWAGRESTAGMDESRTMPRWTVSGLTESD